MAEDILNWFENPCDFQDFDDMNPSSDENGNGSAGQQENPEGNDLTATDILFCVLSGDDSTKNQLNDVLYHLQASLTGLKKNGELNFRKAFLYGDGQVFGRSFEETEAERIYYLDCLAAPVSWSEILMIAQSWLTGMEESKQRPEQMSGRKPVLLILRESEFGIRMEEERRLSRYFEGTTPAFYPIMATNKIHNDWLEKFVRKNGGKTVSFSDTDSIPEFLKTY